jgi:hypothetical protein
MTERTRERSWNTGWDQQEIEEFEGDLARIPKLSVEELTNTSKDVRIVERAMEKNAQPALRVPIRAGHESSAVSAGGATSSPQPADYL